MLFKVFLIVSLLLVSVVLAKPIILFARTIIQQLESQILKNREHFAKENTSNKYQSSVNQFFVIFAIFILSMTALYCSITYLWLGFLLLVCGIIDFETRFLPEELSTLLLWSGLMLSSLQLIELPLKESLWGAVTGFGLIFILDSLLKMTQQGAFGSGDAPFLAAIGAWSGPLLVPLIFSLALLGHPRNGARKPFGHRLAMAGWICVLLRLIARKV